MNKLKNFAGGRSKN